MSILYVLAAGLLAITIVGIPFAKQSLKLAGFILWPFGRTLIPSETRNKGISVVGNVLWIVLAGIWIAIAHLISGCLLCLTIIGIPLGVANFKFAGAALAPFGKVIVNESDLGEGAAGTGDRRPRLIRPFLRSAVLWHRTRRAAVSGCDR